MLDQNGCDTAHWKLNYSGAEKVPPASGSSTYDFTVPLGQVFVDGTATHPKSLWPTTGNVRSVSFDYKDRLCLGNGKFTYKVRMRAHDTTLTTNFEYIGLMALKFDNYPVTDFYRMEIHKTFLSIAINGSTVNYTNPFTLSFNDFHDMSVKFNNDSVYVYFDNTLFATRYYGKPTSRVNYFYVGLGSREPELEYMKLLDLSGNTLFSEEFVTCNQTVVNVPRFKPSTCTSDFTSYFNQRKGTNFSFNQIDSVYYSRIGMNINICADDCNTSCDSLRTYYNFFNLKYDSFITKTCSTATGLTLVGTEYLSCCQSKFREYANAKLKQTYTYAQLRGLFSKCGIVLDYCEPAPAGPILCGRTEPLFPEVPFTQYGPCDDSTNFAIWKGTLLYEAYRDSILGTFDDKYLAKCLNARYRESFTVTQPTSEFHYTLYYYDQAGNLLKTVPPAGVDISKFSVANWSTTVQTARLNKTVAIPSHTLVTHYRYNSLNQVVAQKTPDAGISEFWYDRLGRLVISRNAQQKASLSTSLYSYTKYDYLGRITEVGQIKNTVLADTMKDVTSRNQTTLANWLLSRNSNRGQMTVTVYDLPNTLLVGVPDDRLIIKQKNLRNRVSYVLFYDSSASSAYSSGTFYSYDIHGNVDTLLQDFGLGTSTYARSAMNTNNNRWKKMVYKYDLISGKVNMVMYQPGWGDQSIHRYSYDAENRLTLVETSRDSLVWEKDARYEYYRHGPLARVTIGDQLVQGTDYAYTLQGWLKGTNSTGGRALHDMGGDGRGTGSDTLNRYTGKDAMAYTLNYFTGDYTAINNNVAPFPASGAYLNAAYRPLYNGNISSMITTNRKLTDPTMIGGPIMLYNYKYDQLNRITAMDSYNGFDTMANSWSGSAAALLSYNERISYDGNGNILGYLRNANTYNGGPLMDSLTYKYYTGTNRLSRVTDRASSFDSQWGSNSWEYNIDLDHQTSTTNYTYDAIGNLITDAKEGITSIKWSVYGKILEINRTASTNNPVTKIVYKYDPQGNRIGKIVSKTGTTVRDHTWYVRDAQGNVMSVYTASGAAADGSLSSLVLNQAEKHIYGSSRLGINSWYEPVDGGPYDMTNFNTYTFKRGMRQYELSNHLGNVLATVSDKKIGVPIGSTTAIDYYEPDIVSAQDYYPFGMLMPKRSYSAAGTYRAGFNGKENDNEVKGLGNQQDYGMRIYDPRIGRFLSVDPITSEYPELTPYQFSSNSPIAGIDKDGLEFQRAVTKAARVLLKRAAKDFVEKGIEQRFKAYMSKKWYKQLGNDASDIMDILGEQWWEVAISFAPGGGIYDAVNTGLDLIKAGKLYNRLQEKVKFTENLLKFGERYADKAENILKAIEGRGNLRKKIQSFGKADGDDLIVNHGKYQERIKNWVAHHLIPVEALQKNEVVQAAVAAGFDFNGAANGLPVSADKHNSGGHKGYNAKVFELIKAWSDKQGDKGFTPDEAKKFLETDLIPQLKEFVNKVEKLK